MDRRLVLLVIRRQHVEHVRVHVGDEEIRQAVVVEVEELDPHRAPRRSREALGRLVDEAAAAVVLEVVSVPLHVEHEHVRPAVAVHVGDARVAAPPRRPQADLRGDVPEPVVPEVSIQHRVLEAIGMRVAEKRVGEPDIGAVRPHLIRRVAPDVADEQIEQAVAVVVEEHRSRRVRDEIEAGLLRDVPEASVPVVLEQHVAAAHRRDEEILIAVVVHVGERRRHADSAGERDARLFRDRREPAAAGVLPELVAADLVDEVDVGQAVAVDVGDREARAVVVVHGLVVFAGVLDDAVDEGDAALGQLVGELKVVERADAARALDLLRAPRRERLGAHVRVRRAHFDRRRRCPSAAARRGQARSERDDASRSPHTHRQIPHLISPPRTADRSSTARRGS